MCVRSSNSFIALCSIAAKWSSPSGLYQQSSPDTNFSKTLIMYSSMKSFQNPIFDKEQASLWVFHHHVLSLEGKQWPARGCTLPVNWLNRCNHVWDMISFAYSNPWLKFGKHCWCDFFWTCQCLSRTAIFFNLPIHITLDNSRPWTICNFLSIMGSCCSADGYEEVEAWSIGLQSILVRKLGTLRALFLVEIFLSLCESVYLPSSKQRM